MPARRLIATASRWTVGMTLATWRYLRDRPTVSHRLVAGCDCEMPDFHRHLPAGERPVKHPDDGSGPLFHRRYTAVVRAAPVDAAALIARLREDPNVASPLEYAHFDALGRGPLDDGTELVVRLPGPWNGPVRVVDTAPTAFRLVTLRGHLEAGEIEFRATDDEDGALRIEIESWARSGDPVMNVLYAKLGVAREMQLAMWTHFLRRAADVSGGRLVEPIEVVTHVHDAEVA